jgi:hypothetical protein
MTRSKAPANTTPPAVASTPEVCGARSRAVQTVCRVSGEGLQPPYWPSLSGRGRMPQLTPEESAPRPDPPVRERAQRFAARPLRLMSTTFKPVAFARAS